MKANKHLELYKRGIQGRIQDFKLEGAHLKKMRRTDGGAKIVVVFRVKNHDFTPKKIIFFPILGGGGGGGEGGAGCAPWIRPWDFNFVIPSVS